jgi:serine/threonine protein kinase
MQAAGSNASIANSWTDTARLRGMVPAIVQPGHRPSVDIRNAADQESEGLTDPFDRFERTEATGHDPIGQASEAASEAPAHLSTGMNEAPVPKSISLAVLGLTRIGKYEVLGTLGRGSFGVVYTARDTELDREVALKVLSAMHHGDEDAVHRFLREARAAARIAHPGIVTVYDCGRYVPDDGEELAYIAMERLRGESLIQRLRRVGRLPLEEAAEIVRQVAAALDAAHRADVLHRDLKPDNVYLVPDPAAPSGERAKVLDFGLAKIGASRHTRLGSVFGTPLYMSPEQCRSAAEIDARSDIYALGCILFELLTGRPPFEGTIFAVIERHLHERAPSAASLLPDLPPALDVLMAAMLEKAPDDRPQTMAEVARTLEDVLAARRSGRGAARSAEAAAPPPAPAPAPVAAAAPRRKEVARGSRGFVVLLAAIITALALAGALSLFSSLR